MKDLEERIAWFLDVEVIHPEGEAMSMSIKTANAKSEDYKYGLLFIRDAVEQILNDVTND